MRIDPQSAPPLAPTAYHTVGPFFPANFIEPLDHDLARGDSAAGPKIRLAGTVFQETGEPLPNTIVELWQADSGGRFAHPADPRHAAADVNFAGWGRSRSKRDGSYEFLTVMPGTYEEAGVWRAPHLNLYVFASGIMGRLCTTVFFPGDARNATDPVLAQVPSARRAGLFLRPDGESGDTRCYRFDIFLRGANETPFFVD